MLVRPTISFEKMGFVIWIKFGQSGAFFSFWQDANFNFAQKNRGTDAAIAQNTDRGTPPSVVRFGCSDAQTFGLRFRRASPNIGP